MKFTAVSCLLAAIWSASYVLAEAMAEPEVLEAQPYAYLEARQGAVDATTVVTAAATQAATVTTEWFESTIDQTTTYVEIIYTQTFASVPDQWTTGGVGSIGYGTLTKTKAKRDEPVETGIAGRIKI